MAESNRHLDDPMMAERTWDAFTGTILAEHLKTRSITPAVIAGFATSIGVGATARQAHELGFHVTLAIEAMTDISDAHTNSLIRIFPIFGENGTTREIIKLLDGGRFPMSGRFDRAPGGIRLLEGLPDAA